MKKSILTAILAGVMLLSGCSGVSSENNNSMNISYAQSKSSFKNDSGESQISFANATSSEPDTSDSLEDFKNEYKKDAFIIGAKKCGDWYYKEKAGGSIDAVLYVGNFVDIDNVDQFAANFYTSLYDIIINEPNKGFYTYWVLKENGDCVASTSLVFGMTIPVVWMDDYKPLNDNENVKVFDAIWSQKETTTSQPSSSIQPESSMPPIHNEDVLITTAKTLDGKVCAFITNNGTKTIDELEVQIIYKDSSGNIVDTDRDGHDMILPNHTVVSRFNAPKSFDTYEVEHIEEYGVHSTYKNHLEQCEVRSNLGEKCVIVQITNNSNVEIEEFEYIVVFYKGDDIASVSYPKDVYHIAPNKTTTEKVSTYSLDFDRFEVYVNQAHTFR